MIRPIGLALLATVVAAVAAPAAPAQESGISQFALFDRPLAESDALPAIFSSGRTPSCDWSQPRRGSSNVWLLPGTGAKGPCISATYDFNGRRMGATAAGGPAYVQPTGLSMTSSGFDHDPMIVGAVPDGIDTVFFELADGSTEQVAVVQNTYRASYPSPIVRMSVVGPDGKVSSEPVRFGKRAAPSKKCSKKKHASKKKHSRKRCGKKARGVR
jgi:hypothetical protein